MCGGFSFRKLRIAQREYNEENNTNYHLHEFLIKGLNYTEEDIDCLLHVTERKEKHTSGESKRMNKVPCLPKNVGDKQNPEYEKYYNMVLAFRKYMCNTELRPENGEKKTMRTFMKFEYNLEGDAAVIEMRKIENIVYKGKKSSKPKRNKRRAKREEMFNEKFNLS